MPELRWILLVAGVAFLGALAFWELRRQRRLPPQQVEETTQHRFREPTLGLPELRPREATTELPVIQIDDDSMLGLRVDGVRIEEDVGALSAVSAEGAAIIDTDFYEEPPDTGTHRHITNEQQPIETPSFEEVPGEPIVEWPPEDQRRLLAIKLAAPAGERFSGRALRLAFAAEGFVMGKYSIFHKPGPDSRALVSAASAKQPGSFDLQTMDTQRYGGVGLFAVLPGPLPDRQLLEALLEAGRNLQDRLQGTLQNERGEPLDTEGIAQLRASLEPGAGPEPSAAA